MYAKLKKIRKKCSGVYRLKCSQIGYIAEYVDGSGRAVKKRWTEAFRNRGKTKKVASEEKELKMDLENINSLMKTETGRIRMKLAEKRKMVQLLEQVRRKSMLRALHLQSTSWKTPIFIKRRNRVVVHKEEFGWRFNILESLEIILSNKNPEVNILNELLHQLHKFHNKNISSDVT